MAWCAKNVLMTSNGEEISKGIAYHLAKSGCRLVLMGDKDSLMPMVREIKDSSGGRNVMEVVGLDMEEEKETVFDEAVGKAWSLLGSLDSFVNTTAYEGEIQDFVTMSEREYRKSMAINFTAPWFILKSFTRRLRDAKTGGSIIFLTQIIGADRGLYQGSAAYGSCLAAVHQLVRLAALESGKHNIRVNAVARGLRMEDPFPQSVGKERAEARTSVAMPLLRWLDPKRDLASTILYLISDDSCYMTGTTIFIDGAQSLVRPRMRSFI